MKRKRFSTEQIIRILNEAQLGITVKDLCRKYGILEGFTSASSRASPSWLSPEAWN